MCRIKCPFRPELISVSVAWSEWSISTPPWMRWWSMVRLSQALNLPVPIYTPGCGERHCESKSILQPGLLNPEACITNRGTTMSPKKKTAFSWETLWENICECLEKEILTFCQFNCSSQFSGAVLFFPCFAFSSPSSGTSSLFCFVLTTPFCPTLTSKLCLKRFGTLSPFLTSIE